METMLNQTADGTAGPLQRWYALAHAANCGHCAQFLDALQHSIGFLRGSKVKEPSAEVLTRLANGPWRDVSPDTQNETPPVP